MDIRTMAIVATSLWLAACGGSGGGGGGTGSTPPPGGTSTSGTYRLEATPADAPAAVQQLLQQGAAGNAWVSSVASYQASPQFSELYLHSSLRQSSTFLYLMDSEPAAMADLLTLLNLRGGQGYAYKGSYLYGATAHSIFVKDSTKTATYTYESLTSVVNGSLANLLAQANVQGGRGFRWLGSYATAAAPALFSNLYAKDSTGPATYTYSAISLGASFAPTNGGVLAAHLQQGAADGSRYLGTILAGAQYAMIFERPAGSTTATGYAIDSVPANESLATMLQAVNTRAAQGRFLWSDVVTMDGALHRIYTTGLVLPHPLYGLVYP